MSDSSIQQVSPNNTALNAEHYQSFEMAKVNDGILGGDDIAQIRSYAAFARAQAQAVHKSIASMSELEDVTATKAEMTETAQTFAKVGIYADQRIGEILRELPTKQGKRSDLTSLPTGNEVTKTEAIQDAGLTPKTASQLEQLAANPEVVEAVIAKAEQDGRIVSRSQVLKAIKERDKAREDLEDAYMSNEVLEREIDNLKRKVSERPEPEVIERDVEVVREVMPEDVQQRINELERLNNLYLSDYQKLRRRNEDMRKELDCAHDILNLDETTREVQRDVQYLVTSTNQYIRHYGGLTWTVQSLSEVDGQMIEELHKAVRNLATFANTLMNCLEEING